ncbi:MAG: dienelactone hydrolase family protein [Gammaproteobacteria bacterium]|nr:dienelactone hydrolase family protein [Gammaproteobacteria bacterium]
MRSLWIGTLLFTLGLGAAHAAIVTQEIDYTVDGTTLKGYLAYDDAIEGARPGVLVVHEWWGMNDYARRRAHMLAELGYTAFALDMYGDGKQAHHPDEAGKFASEVMKNQDLARARFNGALEVLRKQKTVDPARVAAIGYCFGGAVVLQMARDGADLDGVVSFHGNLAPVSPAQPGAVKAKILVLTGADDSFVPAEQIEQFEKEMDAAKADYKVIVYPGAKHSFTSPEADKYGQEFNLPLAYNKAADEASWQEMQDFFQQILK